MARLARIPLSQWMPGRAWRIVTIVGAADEIPARLPKKGAVVVGSLKNPKWIAFDCPCGTGHRVLISLDRGHFPHWVIANTSKLSLYPSVDYKTPSRRCHYFVKNGRTVWVKPLRDERHV